MASASINQTPSSDRVAFLDFNSSAIFNVGDECLYRQTGDKVKITQAYQQRRTGECGGEIQFRFAYVGKFLEGDLANGTDYCIPAGDLLELNGRWHHLKLVRPPAPAMKKSQAPTATEARKALVDLVKKCDAKQSMDVIRLVSIGADGLEERIAQAVERGLINETQAEMARVLAKRIGMVLEEQEVAHG